MGTSGIHIPTDILFWHILIRLPVKSLKRFQCVHKSWNALTKDPNFVAQHFQFHNRNYPNQYCFLASIKSVCKSGHSLKFLNFKGSTIDNIDSLDWRKFSALHVEIRGPSNGIYCFIDVDDSRKYDFPKSIVLANISLREFKDVDQLSIFSSNRKTLIPNFYIEFGFDHKANDYKVVFITSVTDFRGNRNFEVAIYSLRSNSWKKVRECHTLQDIRGYSWEKVRECHTLQDIRGFYNQYSAAYTFVHGNFHWAATSFDVKDCIISFDIVREAFGKIELPSSFCSRSLKDVMELNESLCLLSLRGEIWVMQEYGKKESWTKLYTIELENVGKPMGLLRNGHIINEVHRDWLIIYNRYYGGSAKFVRDVDAAASTQNTGYLGSEPLKFYSTRIYSESLVSLKDYEGM